MGFPAPFDKWIKDERFKTEIKEYLDAFKERNIVDGDSLEQVYIEHINGDLSQYSRKSNKRKALP